MPAISSAQEGLFETSYKEIGEKYGPGFGLYAVYSVTNISGRDIDDISMSLSLRRADGESLASTGQTDQTPGLVWLRAGETTEVGVPVGRSPEAVAILEHNPDDAVLVIEINEISYME